MPERLIRFIDVSVPVLTCNFRCEYCYVTHHSLFGNSLPEFSHSPLEFKRAISRKRLGGVCMFNFCGCGETLLPPLVPEFVRAALSEGHYVMVVTNGTVDSAFDKFAEFPEEFFERLFFKFSFHYMQLRERGLFNRFFRNINRMRDLGASFTLELTPSDSLIPYIEDIKRMSIENVGALCHVTIPRDERNGREIPLLSNMEMSEFAKTWGVFDSPLFDYKLSVFSKKQNGFCYAGSWTYFLDLGTGNLSQCYCSYYLQNIYSKRSIRRVPIGENCPLPHCYNAHAFLTFGDIPNHSSPTYFEMRNRTCADGTEWIRPRMKAFMEQKLYRNNSVLSGREILMANLLIRLMRCLKIVRHGIARVVRIR